MGETGVVKIDRYGDRSNIELDIQVVYMSSKILQLTVRSHDLSQPEK